jgi:hypothetical protein
VALHKRKLSKVRVFAVSFHLTDWLGDLYAYQRFCLNSRYRSDAELDGLLAQFLMHTPDHLAAAKKLYTSWPVTDVFGVGAVATRKRMVKDGSRRQSAGPARCAWLR